MPFKVIKVGDKFAIKNTDKNKIIARTFKTKTAAEHVKSNYENYLRTFRKETI